MDLIDPRIWKWLIPEVACFETRKHRRIAWDRALNYGFVLRTYFPFAAITTSIVVYGLIQAGWAKPVLPLIVLLIITPAVFIRFLVCWRRTIRASLRRTLRSSDRCEHCGYPSQRDGDSGRCPECGHTQPMPGTPVSVEQSMPRD